MNMHVEFETTRLHISIPETIQQCREWKALPSIPRAMSLFCGERAVVVFNPDGIVDRPALAARKEEPRDQQFGKTASPLRILRTDGLSALRINLPEPARVEYTIFDSRGRTVAMRDAGRLPVGEHRLPIGGNQVGAWAGAVLFVRVRVTATGGESTTHILRCVHKGL